MAPDRIVCRKGAHCIIKLLEDYIVWKVREIHLWLAVTRLGGVTLKCTFGGRERTSQIFAVRTPVCRNQSGKPPQ